MVPKRSRGGDYGDARLLAIVCVVVGLVLGSSPCVLANTVRYQAVVDGTINGEVVRNAVFKCEGSDGREVFDADSVKLTLENGAEMDINVRCKPPVYVYERTYAGSIPGRVVPMTAPVCDTPIVPIAAIEESAPPSRRRLLRMVAAGMHTARAGSFANTIFSHFTPEDWVHYEHGTRSLEELGIAGDAAIAIRVNITLVHYLHQRMEELPDVLGNFDGLGTLVGGDDFYFPPFMRDAAGNVVDVEYERVFHNFMDTGGDRATNSTSTSMSIQDPNRRHRRLFFGVAMSAAALGMSAYAVGVINNQILPKLNAIDDAMEKQARANDAMRGMIKANEEFAQETFTMAQKNLDATKALGRVQDTLVKKTSANADAILENKDALIAQGQAMDTGFADATRERQAMMDVMVAQQAESIALNQAVTGDLRNLQDFVLSGFDQVNGVLDSAMEDRVRDLQSVRRDIQAVAMQLRQTNILMYRHRLNAKLRRNIAGLFHDMNTEAHTKGLKEFLWDGSSGDDADVVRAGVAPNLAKWTPGNPERRVDIDTISVLYSEYGSVVGEGLVQNTIHQLDLAIVCDGEVLMNEVTPWFTWKDIAQLMGPDYCVPLPPKGVTLPPGTAAQPDASVGQWLTEANGDAKFNSMTGGILTPCKCWIEVRGASCTDHPRDQSQSPFEHVGLETDKVFGPGGLASAAPSVCDPGQQGATPPVAWQYSQFSALHAIGVNTYSALDFLPEGDILENWMDPDLMYLSSWQSLVTLLEDVCGDEKFQSRFPGNPLDLGFRRPKYFGDGAAYALITSATLSSMYEPGPDVANFVLKVVSNADAGRCNTQNTVGNLCAEGTTRTSCESCQRCSASEMSVTRYNQDTTRPATLAALFYLTLENAWKSVQPRLQDMEVDRYGTLPSDVSTSKEAFQNDPVTRTSFECTYASWVYTVPEYVPVHKLRPTQIAMKAEVSMTRWGNDGDELDPSTYIKVPGTDEIALDANWYQTTSDPELENRFSFILPPDMLLPGSKDCMWNECQRPGIFFDANSNIMDTTGVNERYTYDIPQDMITASPDASGRANRVSYILSKKTPEVIAADGFTLNEWVAENNHARFRAVDAGTSLHWYYTPLVKNGDDVQCATAGGTHTGGWCNTLQKYRVYMPTADDYDDPGLTSKCNSDQYLCLIPKVWKYEWQASLKKGDITQGVTTGCPTLDTSAITDAQVPTLYMFHSQASPIRTRITIDGPGCTTHVDEYDVPPNKRVGIDVEVCGAMTITAEEWSNGEWVDCSNSVESVDVQEKPEFEFDVNATTTILRETTVIRSTDNTEIANLAEDQNAMLADALLALSVVTQLLPESNQIQLRELTPSVFNTSKLEAIMAETAKLKNQSVITEAENSAERWNIIQEVEVQKADFENATAVIDAELETRIGERDAAIEAAEAQLKVMNESLANLTKASFVADAALAEASAALRHAASIEVDVVDLGNLLGPLKSIGGMFGAFGIAALLATCLGPIAVVLLVALCLCCRGPEIADWTLDFLDRAGKSEGAMNVLQTVVPTGKFDKVIDVVSGLAEAGKAGGGAGGSGSFRNGTAPAVGAVIGNILSGGDSELPPERSTFAYRLRRMFRR